MKHLIANLKAFQEKPIIEKFPIDRLGALIDTLKDSFPEKLVRFYGNINYARDVIKNNQLTLIRVDQFNDPFELINNRQYHHNLFDNAYNDRENKLLDVKNTLHVRLSDPNMSKINKWLWKNVISLRLSQIKKESDLKMKRQEAKANPIKNHYICSLSNINMKFFNESNMHMFTNYANGHRGIAIEFNYALLNFPEQDGLAINKPPQDGLVFYKPIRVVYLKENSIIDKKSTAEKDVFADLYKKYHYFKYEKEYRIIHKNWWKKRNSSKKFIKQPLPKNAISAVYLGLETSKKDEERIKKQLTIYNQSNTEKAKLFKARKVEGEYKIEFYKIELEPL